MEQEKLEKLTSELEAVLFIFGEPVSKKKLAATLEVPDDSIDAAAKALGERLALEKGRGIMLVDHQDRLMLATKPEHEKLVEKFITEDLKEELTPAAVETLSLIAYFGPITRAEIDYLRGVNSSFIVRALLVRGLIDRTSSKGNAYVYEVSFQFLKHMGIDHVSKMPHYEEYQKLKDQYFSKTDLQDTPPEPGNTAEPIVSPAQNE